MHPFLFYSYTLVKTYRFDGVDLAWQFKTNKPKRVRSGLGKTFYNGTILYGFILMMFNLISFVFDLNFLM